MIATIFLLIKLYHGVYLFEASLKVLCQVNDRVQGIPHLVRNCCVYQLLEISLILDLFEQHVLRDILDLDHGLFFAVFDVVFDLDLKIMVRQRVVFVFQLASFFQFNAFKFQILNFPHLVFLLLTGYIRLLNNFEYFGSKHVLASVLLRNGD